MLSDTTIKVDNALKDDLTHQWPSFPDKPPLGIQLEDKTDRSGIYMNLANLEELIKEMMQKGLEAQQN